MPGFVKKMVPKSVKRLYHLGWAVFSIIAHGRPSKQLRVIGVTGTDGKTTTTTFIYNILKHAGFRVAMINGMTFSLPSKQWKNHSDNSTPGKTVIRKFLRRAVEEYCDVVILEVTSWGVEQHRVFGVAFDVAAITNFTYEHLDLHGTMENYRAMKGKLFEALQSARKPDQPKTAVLNKDDKEFDFFSQFEADQKFVYSAEGQADISATNIKEEDTLNFDLHHGENKKSVQMRVRGLFNVSNALAATGASLAVGASLESAKAGLESVEGVSGRMEMIEKGQPFHVIVDFAHTPNGFKQLFTAARKIAGDHNVIAVYGATGDRDHGRRPMVGKLAGEMIDYSVLTTEDPHTEDPADIAKQVEKGLIEAGKKEGDDYTYVEDRADAILAASERAKPGDVVLLCSMGDYDVMYVGEGKIPWSDRKAAERALEQITVQGEKAQKIKS